MSTSYKNLEQLMGGYFNQDWPIEGETDDAIIKLFLHDSSPERISGAINELDHLIAVSTDDDVELGKLLRNLGCDYYYPAFGLTGLEWLVRIRALLTEED